MKKITFLVLLITTINFAQSNTEVFLFDISINNLEIKLSNPKNISNNKGYDNQPSFLDNYTILYAGTRNGQTDIAKYEIDTKISSWVNSTEGSEYSPLKIPNKNAISAIRLDKDGTQKLYQYNIFNGNSQVLIDSLVVGYHTWFDDKTVVSAVLEGNDSMSLFISDVETGENTRIDENIGRSLHKIPNSDLVSYISKKNEKWEIKSYNPSTKEIKFIAYTLPKAEDMCWLVDGTILMAKDDILYRINPFTENAEWKEAFSLKQFGIKNITRLAISSGLKLAVVGENSNEKQAPKLENVAWIAGTWKGEAFGGITEEIWSEPLGDSMMGSFKLVSNNKVSFYEIEIIREVNNTLILQLKHFNNDLKGWETKDETVDFPLKEITKNKVVFEGMIFEKIAENEMNIYVDIHKESGEIETVKFNYKK